MWGGGVPSPPGEGVGEGAVPLPRKNSDFGSQYGEFWCILDGIFYSLATCFTLKTGVIWCPSPYLFNFFASKRTWFIFLQKFHAAGPVLVQYFRMHYIILRPNSAKASALQYSA